MILGIGIDTVEPDRFARALDRAPALLQRVFAPAERELSLPSLAARFAAREAAVKALGGIHGLRLADFEVVRSQAGAPAFRVPPPLAAVLERRGVRRLHLSLTHERHAAAAFVIAEG